MSTPIQKEFGPGYDHPNRKFHFWAVILPTVLAVALAVALMRHTGSAGSRVTHNPIVTCPTQMCPPTGAASSATPTQSAKQASGPAAELSAAQIALGDKNPPPAASATGSGSSRPSSPSPSSNSAPTSTSPPSSFTGSSPTPVLSVTRAVLSPASPAATHAVVLSSA
jgi:hypothetical protein